MLEQNTGEIANDSNQLVVLNSTNHTMHEHQGIVIYNVTTPDVIIKTNLPDGSTRYNVKGSRPSFTSELGLPSIISVTLDDPKKYPDKLEIAIEFAETDVLTKIYEILDLFDAEYEEYRLNHLNENGDKVIDGNQVIDIKSSTIPVLSALSDLYIKVNNTALLLNEVLTPMVEWGITKDEPKLKQKMALWFASWSDPSEKINFVKSYSKECLVIDDSHYLAMRADETEITLHPDVYDNKKIEQTQKEELKESYRQYYRSLPQKEKDNWYESSVAITIEARKQEHFERHTINNTKVNKIRKIFDDKDERIKYLTKKYPEAKEILAQMIASIKDKLTTKENYNKLIKSSTELTELGAGLVSNLGDYEKTVKSAKELPNAVMSALNDGLDYIVPNEKTSKNFKAGSTLAGVTYDIVVSKLLVGVAMIPVVGPAASAIIGGAIFYGISLTKTASSTYSLKTLNGNSKEDKSNSCKIDEIMQDLLYKSALCNMEKFSLFDDEAKKLLEKIFLEKIEQYVLNGVCMNDPAYSDSLLMQFASEYSIAQEQNVTDNNHLLYNGTNPIYAKDYFSFNKTMCYNKVLLGLYKTISPIEEGQ